MPFLYTLIIYYDIKNVNTKEVLIKSFFFSFFRIVRSFLKYNNTAHSKKEIIL